jgi:hypothetical protein
MHLQQIADAIEDSHLKWLVGEVECDDTDPDPCWNNKDARLIHVRRILSLKEEGPKTESFWIESCDCGGSPLIDRLATQWPTRMEGGLPCVTQDLRWREDISFVCCRFPGCPQHWSRCRKSYTDSTSSPIGGQCPPGCRSWLRETVYVNPFEALAGQYWCDSSDGESLSSSMPLGKRLDYDTDGEQSDCSTCA